MAFNKETPAAKKSAGAGKTLTNKPEQTSDEAWKAQGFLNFYLPSKNGGRRKLGAIPLKAKDASQGPLLAWLQANPDNAAKILAALQIEFKSSVPNDDTLFDVDSFGADTAPEAEEPKAA